MKNYEQKHHPIRSWAEDDRPREKFILKGRSSLSDAELLAIQLGSGSRNESALDLAKRILTSVKGSYSQLARLSVEELMKFKGVGEAKAINILSSLEIGRRRKDEIEEPLPKIRHSSGIYEMFRRDLVDIIHEEFWCIFLSTSNRVLRKELISKGGMASTVVDIRMILKRALLLSASSIVAVHNHPSGDVAPSEADKILTKRINDGAQLLDIYFLDHVIIGNNKYFSFADEGLL